MSGRTKTIDQILEEVKEKGTVIIKGVGTFQLKEVPAKTRRNPKTGEPVEAPAFKKIAFKMSKALRDELAG